MATKTIAGDVATVSKSGSLDLHTVANRKASQTVLGKKKHGGRGAWPGKFQS